MAQLFTGFETRGVKLKNRVVIAPMQMYRAEDGAVTEWHAPHLAKFAVGGAGLVFVEAAAVTPEGRNTYGDLGLWSDAFVPGLASLAEAIRRNGAVPGIQLFHCGPKAARQRPWEGYGPVGPEQAAKGEVGWPPFAPSAVAQVEGWAVPRAMTIADIAGLIEAYRAGAR